MVSNFLAGSIFLAIIAFLGYYPQQEDFVLLLPGFIAAFGVYYFSVTKLVRNQTGQLPQVFLFAAHTSNPKGSPSRRNTLKNAPNQTFAFWLGIAILARFLLLFSLPNLSDDLYRFIWDGRLLNQGINPFEQLPSYYLLAGNEVQGITQTLFDELNSPEYFTVYPPVCQAIFAFSTWLFPNSILGTVVTMKAFFLIFEMGTIFLGIRLLDHFKLDRKQILWYALNPLIILELTGNLHFEALMVFFLMAAIYFYVKSGITYGSPHLSPKGSPTRKYTLGNLLLSGVAMGFAIATKLLPLMFLPFFIKRLGWKKAMIYFTVIGVTVVALFTPLFSSVFLSNIGSSIGLYFQRFEFNGSIYYLLRWLGQQITGYNLIRFLGPILALIVFLGIIFRAFREKDWNDDSDPSVFLPSHTSVLKEASRADRLEKTSPQKSSTLQLFRQMLFALTLFLFCTTTVMPWYLSGLILFSVFTGHRYPVVWSFMILMTYVNYSYPVFSENLWVVGIEYLVVGFFVWRERGISQTQPPPIKNANPSSKHQ